ncbi:hypothetical protein SAMN06269185_2462 [Natronoarchaeum philippinense]|uniref:PrgI family protein n=1 Tax=Natronoarchaeum philippinense TaxID=558529 RepID=A0A285P639_NATPI|nr:hypothetical protein [Natronoarchaeum philippinense]SNZ15341.1 hypothetical protein SAMN06269185_2462 [Natronoarchaeum philippinense]
MSTNDPTKRIPSSIGTDTQLFGKYTLSDLAVGLFPGVVVILLAQVVVPPEASLAGISVQTLTLPFAGAGIAVGALFVYLTPTYTTSMDWIGTFLGFQRRETQHAHVETTEYTHLKRVYPDDGVLERTDGTLFGLVQVDPPSMALATTDQWRTQSRAFADFLDTVIEFPIQLYSTTRDFPVEEYLAHYEDRRTDPDVQANPQLEALIDEYVEWYRTDLEERRMTIRDHYVIVSVAPEEVQFERESLTQKVARIPVIGLLLRAWFAPRSAERHEAMLTALSGRLQRVEAGLREMDGCGAHQIDADDATQLLGEFWSGEPIEYGNLRSALRTRPVVGGKSE